jgi:hypothetical protein
MIKLRLILEKYYKRKKDLNRERKIFLKGIIFTTKIL